MYNAPHQEPDPSQQRHPVENRRRCGPSRHLHTSPFRIRPTTTLVTRWEAWRDRLSETQHFRHARDHQKPRRLHSRRVSDLRWGGKNTDLAYTPYFRHLTICGHETPMAALAQAVRPNGCLRSRILPGEKLRGHCDRISPPPPPPRLHREHVRVS